MEKIFKQLEELRALHLKCGHDHTVSELTDILHKLKVHHAKTR